MPKLPLTYGSMAFDFLPSVLYISVRGNFINYINVLAWPLTSISFVKYTITWLQIKFSGQTISLNSSWGPICWYMMIIRELGPSWFWNWLPHYGNQSTELIGLIIMSWSIWYQWIMSTSLNKKTDFQIITWICWVENILICSILT